MSNEQEGGFPGFAGAGIARHNGRAMAGGTSIFAFGIGCEAHVLSNKLW